MGRSVASSHGHSILLFVSHLFYMSVNVPSSLYILFVVCLFYDASSPLFSSHATVYIRFVLAYLCYPYPSQSSKYRSILLPSEQDFDVIDFCRFFALRLLTYCTLAFWYLGLGPTIPYRSLRSRMIKISRSKWI
ncbi:hypothetical protein BDN71DRAFT_94504 [Pleurotus eryngii]|uniref:Transmembrane protein n=1 Tax=Pleurotus eryngii TaxID=5323 RepID=A0A9P5ZPF8_PLEER|nr:hypothetical protein BDN71DRAFT_94504 [Pleurotus eryngii]